MCETTERFPRGYGFLVDQLNRAALSNAANIAEGNGRFTSPDRRIFFGIARGSAQKCVPLLELARRRGLLADSVHHALSRNLRKSAACWRAWFRESGSVLKTHPPTGNHNGFATTGTDAGMSSGCGRLATSETPKVRTPVDQPTPCPDNRETRFH
ncbi:MAG: four helix bundle protein [Planctomycetaceae bacterium]